MHHAKGIDWLNIHKNKTQIYAVYKTPTSGGWEDGRELGQGDHFLLHKFIERTFERWANSTKQLLNAGRGHQAPRKAAHCLQKEVTSISSLPLLFSTQLCESLWVFWAVESRGWSCTDHVADHALITLEIMPWSRGWSCTLHVPDHALI